MASNHNVLVLSAGRRVELVQIFREARDRRIPHAKVFATDFRPSLSPACQIADRAFEAPKVTAQEYINYLLDLCGQQSIGMLIPTIDTELKVLALNRKRFEDRGVQIVISTPELVAACRDKRKTADIFDRLQISQPAIYPRGDIQFPCFCKPYDGSCSVGALPLTSPAMLTPELLANEKNMFMELIGKDYSEYTIDAYYDRSSRLCCLVPRERIEVRGGEISKGATRKNFVYDYLDARLPLLEGARGCITVQVFANPITESIKALEINPRFGGGYPLAEAAGANYPDWLIREYLLNESVPCFDEWEPNLLMLRYDAKVIVHENKN